MANHTAFQDYDSDKVKLVGQIVYLQRNIKQEHRNYAEEGLRQCPLEQLQSIYDHCQAMHDEEQAETTGYTNGHDNGTLDKQYQADQINKRTQQKGYTQNMVSNWGYFQEAGLNTNERMMMMVLLRFCWNAGKCTVYQATIKTDMGCSISTVYRTQKSLAEKGWINVTDNAGKSTYQILKKEIIPPRRQRSQTHH